MLIYDDSIDFEFEAGDHKYTIRHKTDGGWSQPIPVEGVTTLLGVISKPALRKWPMNMALSYLRDNHLGEKLDELKLEQAKQAHLTKQDHGKQAGTVGHALVEALIAGKRVKLPDEPEAHKQAESVQRAYIQFIERYAPAMELTEQSFYSRIHDYAGTFDAIAVINGKRTLIDWKTTNTSYYNPDGIYGEYFAQLGAYLIGWQEMTGEPIDDLMIVNLPKDGSDVKVKGLADLGLSRADAKSYFLQARYLHKLNKEFNWKVKQ